MAAPLVMVLGDSFTAGSGPVKPWQTYAAETARELGWQLVTAGAPGTGYVNPGRVGRTFFDSFVLELSWRPAPDLLIVSGGHNDRGVFRDQAGQAARALLETVRARWPGTRIAVIGPIWMTPAPPWAYGVRDAVAAVAAGERAPFLDPIDRRWGDDALLPDGVHPTREGHVRLARWLVAALREHGIGRDVY
ncbi:SGNH/GDSL hydrolase family protein [Streptosporangium sp. NPDC048047]|uniref:SGNH/GDSL hydrolase family protein n=1 Tax=Streptosporangium sp. NPDC048047 TaxID=3155748 RepID=UPI003447AF48